MEPIRFADILFIFLTLVITFAILWLINNAKNKSKPVSTGGQSVSSEAVVAEQEGESIP